MLSVLFVAYLAASGDANLLVTPHALQPSADKIQSMAIASFTSRDAFASTVRNGLTRLVYR
jgi:hypothetical protein